MAHSQQQQHHREEKSISTRTLSGVAFGLVVLYLVVAPSAWPSLFAVIPFVAMITKGIDVSLPNGILLSGGWIVYSLLMTSFLRSFLGRFHILVVYIPIGIVFYKKAHEPADALFSALMYLFWDVPLLVWMHLLSKLGQRGLQVGTSPTTLISAVTSHTSSHNISSHVI
jgi:hypothetical protein